MRTATVSPEAAVSAATVQIAGGQLPFRHGLYGMLEWRPAQLPVETAA
ncbi:hypothetical protein [Streptomyces chartreusis]|uniref:Uncharacterized protein n=1 Tax=Streptomyces chartreusis TaxID=1969 RepID=A0A7H8T1K2_STRCX|nr:hypothetical protein [Streptomyces chartreusis]QKZ17389.1 hypothetical protein HUT05_08520 [Streptomyces chartreusis]